MLWILKAYIRSKKHKTSSAGEKAIKAAYLILKFWATNSWKLGENSGESYTITLVFHSSEGPSVGQRHRAAGEWHTGFRQVHVLILVCVQRAFFVSSWGCWASRTFVVSTPNSSGITQEHAVINTPGSSVSCWHGRKDSCSSPCPGIQALHSPSHPTASIHPKSHQAHISLSVWVSLPSTSLIFPTVAALQRQLSIISQAATVPWVTAPPTRTITKSFPNTGILPALLKLLQGPEREQHKLSVKLTVDLGQVV